jgi:hypothetical protein
MLQHECLRIVNTVTWFPRCVEEADLGVGELSYWQCYSDGIKQISNVVGFSYLFKSRSRLVRDRLHKETNLYYSVVGILILHTYSRRPRRVSVRTLIILYCQVLLLFGFTAKSFILRNYKNV